MVARARQLATGPSAAPAVGRSPSGCFRCSHLRRLSQEAVFRRTRWRLARAIARRWSRLKPRAAASPAGGEQPKPDEKKKEGEGEKKDDDKEEKKEETTIKRPEKPPRVPDPREFDVKLDDKGRVPPFNFIGQTWPDVLQWLANISELQPRLARTAERLSQSHDAAKLLARRGPRPHQPPPARPRLSRCSSGDGC